MIFLATPSQNPTPQILSVQRGGCPAFTWQVSDNTAWLQTQVNGETAQVNANVSGLTLGDYQAMVTISPTSVSGVLPITIPVTLHVVDQLYRVDLPPVMRQ